MRPDSLHNNVIYMCSDLSHQFNQVMLAEFRKNGIEVTTEQFTILALLFYKEGINKKEISESINRDKTTITRVVSLMERNGFLKQLDNVNDGRSKLIYLTQKGKEIQEKAVKISGSLYLKMLESLSESDIIETINLLHKCKNNINNEK